MKRTALLLLGLSVLAVRADDKGTPVDDPVEGGWAEFGNDEIGYGWYPIKLVSQEDWEDEVERGRARIALTTGAQHARQI